MIITLIHILIWFTVILMSEHAKLTRALIFEICKILGIFFHWSHRCCLFSWFFDAICQREDKFQFCFLTLNAVKLNQIAIINQNVFWTINHIHFFRRSLLHQKIDVSLLIHNYRFTNSIKTKYNQQKKMSIESWIYYKEKECQWKNKLKTKKTIWQTIFQLKWNSTIVFHVIVTIARFAQMNDWLWMLQRFASVNINNNEHFYFIDIIFHFSISFFFISLIIAFSFFVFIFGFHLSLLIMTFIKKINCRKRSNSQRRQIQENIVNVNQNFVEEEYFIFVNQEIISFLTKILIKEARVLTKKKAQNQFVETLNYSQIINLDLEFMFLSNQFDHSLSIFDVQNLNKISFFFFISFVFYFTIDVSNIFERMIATNERNFEKEREANYQATIRNFEETIAKNENTWRCRGMKWMSKDCQKKNR